VGSLIIVGLCTHKRPEHGMGVGLGQVDANTFDI
jgi:hypothetical protein